MFDPRDESKARLLCVNQVADDGSSLVGHNGMVYVKTVALPPIGEPEGAAASPPAPAKAPTVGNP